MRTPTEIAAEARELIDTSNTKFVPAPIVRIGELSVEFMESTAAALTAADEARAADSLSVGQAIAHLQAEVEALRTVAA